MIQVASLKTPPEAGVTGRPLEDGTSECDLMADARQVREELQMFGAHVRPRGWEEVDSLSHAVETPPILRKSFDFP